ncbi:MAG: DMT family transporter [Luteimonas sp.]
MHALGWLLVVLVGVVLPLQALVNARLGALTAGPLFASLASFVVGSVALLLAWVATRPQGLDTALLARVPWWAWSGGLMGAAFVVISTVMVPRLGAAALICLVVFGQLAGSLLMDHFGVLNPRQPADPLRILGVVLVAAGALLVVKPWQRG